MTSEQNKALYRHFVDQVINNGKYDEIPRPVHRRTTSTTTRRPERRAGSMGCAPSSRCSAGRFPDVHFNIDEMVSEGDRVATRVTGHGTNTGASWACPPSGKEATWGSKGIFRVADGKIAEHWGMPDLLALLGQIGASPGGRILPTADTSGLTPRPDEPPADPADATLLARNKAVVRRVYDDGFSRRRHGGLRRDRRGRLRRPPAGTLLRRRR